MKLNVAQELKQPGRIGRCHEEVVLDRQEYLGNEIRFVAPLTVDGEYFFDGEGFSFKGTATTRLDSECALCGKPFIEELTFDFDERFLREPFAGAGQRMLRLHRRGIGCQPDAP